MIPDFVCGEVFLQQDFTTRENFLTYNINH